MIFSFISGTKDNYLLVVNASNLEKDVEWMNQHKSSDVVIEDKSNDYALLALQGPLAEKTLQKLTVCAIK